VAGWRSDSHGWLRELLNVQRTAPARPSQLRKRHGGGADGGTSGRRRRKSRAPPPPSRRWSIAWNLSSEHRRRRLITTIPKPPAWMRRSKPSTRSPAALDHPGRQRQRQRLHRSSRALRAKARAALLIGAAAPKIAQSISGDASCRSFNAGTLAAAVDQSVALRRCRPHRAARSRLRQLRSVRQFRAPRPRLQGTGERSGERKTVVAQQ
jgi:hypothetical protein